MKSTIIGAASSEIWPKIKEKAKTLILDKLEDSSESKESVSNDKTSAQKESTVASNGDTTQAENINVTFDTSDSAEQKIFNLATLKFVYDSAYDNYHFNASEVNEKITQLMSCEEELARLDSNAADYETKVEEVFGKYDSSVKDTYSFALDTYINYMQTVQNAGEDFDYNSFYMQNIDAAYAFGDVDTETYSKYLEANNRSLIGVDASEIQADPTLTAAMAQGMATTGVNQTSQAAASEQAVQANTINETTADAASAAATGAAVGAVTAGTTAAAATDTTAAATATDTTAVATDTTANSQQTIVTNIVFDDSLKKLYGDEIASALNLSLMRFGMGQSYDGLIDPNRYSELYMETKDYVDKKIEIEKKAQEKEKELTDSGKSEEDAKKEAADFVKDDLESLKTSYSLEAGEDAFYVADTFEKSLDAVKQYNDVLKSDGVDKAIESEGLETAYACGSLDYDQFNAALIKRDGTDFVYYICNSTEEYNQAVKAMQMKDVESLTEDIEDDDGNVSLSYTDDLFDS